jgi:hypothetical protein
MMRYLWKAMRSLALALGMPDPGPYRIGVIVNKQTPRVRK